MHAAAGALLLVLLALAPLAAAQDGEGRTLERGTWTQFEPRWREGPTTFEFGGRSVDVPFGARYATDGSTWLYAADMPPPERPGIPEHCGEAPGEGTWVLLEERDCTFAAHPSVACVGVHACSDAQGLPRTVTPATQPQPTPLSQLLDSCGNPAIPAKCTPLPAALPLVAAALALVVRRWMR